jgi:hypothetical protein
MPADEVIDLEVIGGTAARQPAIRIPRVIADGTISIGLGSALSAGFAPSIVTTFATDQAAGRWWFVGLASAGLLLIVLGVYQQRYLRLHSSAGVVVAVSDGVGEADRLHQDRRLAERQLDRECTVAVTVSGTIASHEPEVVIAAIDQAASRVVQALSIAEQMATDVPSARLVPMMRLHMAFRFGARLGYTFAKPLVLMDKRQDERADAFFAAVRLRAEGHTASTSHVEVTYDDPIDGADPDKAALAINLQAFGRDFWGPVRAACVEYGYGRLVRAQSREARLNTSKDLAYQPMVEEICHAWRHGELPESVHTRERGIFLSGPPSIAVALGARLARQAPGLWIPYQFVPDEGRYRPLRSSARLPR